MSAPYPPAPRIDVPTPPRRPLRRHPLVIALAVFGCSLMVKAMAILAGGLLGFFMFVAMHLVDIPAIALGIGWRDDQSRRDQADGLIIGGLVSLVMGDFLVVVAAFVLASYL